MLVQSTAFNCVGSCGTASRGLPTLLHRRRQQQVAELRQQLPGVEALNRDASLFEVPMRLRDGRHTRLRISLPPGFPEVSSAAVVLYMFWRCSTRLWPTVSAFPIAQARPGLSVTHPIRHPAVDPSGRVSSQGLQQWTPQSSLAAVVVETISLLTGAAPPGQARLSSPTGEAQRRCQPRFGIPLCMTQNPDGHLLYH